MPRVVSVRLRHPGQFYDFDLADLDVDVGDWVIVETVRGQDLGQVVAPPREVAEEEVPGELKPIVRLANEADFRRMERYREKEAEALARVQAKVAEAGIPMRLVATEYTFNGRSLTIYFAAEQRVDFRNLVKELAREFKARIELRQIGARDEARLLGGIGTCGRELCCATWLRDFLRISVRMAKDQELPLSPMKISGVCGRLLCCLSYECDQYREIKAGLPTVGEEVVTLRGRGRVVSVNVPKETVSVEVREGLTVEVTAEELQRASRLDAEGRLAEMQVSAFAPCPAVEEIGEESPQTRETAEPARARRRRRRKKTEAPPPPRPSPAARTKEPPPTPQRGTAPQQATPAPRRKRPGRRPGEAARTEPAARPAGRPPSPPAGTTSEQRPARSRTRRPRRRRPPEGAVSHRP